VTLFVDYVCSYIERDLDSCYVLVPSFQQVCLMCGTAGSDSLTTLTSFEATYLYQYTFILLYNLVFTSLPVIVLGGSFFFVALESSLMICF
jgi:hypothetical protein